MTLVTSLCKVFGKVMKKIPLKIKLASFTSEKRKVRDRTKRYETSAGDWQKVSTAWNRVQYRPNSSDLQETNSTKNERKTAKDEDDLWRQRRKTIKDLIKGGHISIAEQCKSRKLPGYGGFVPREPVESNFDPYSREIFRSSTNRAYRPFPHDVMHDSLTMSNHCRAPLSRLVTLAHPCNPFKGRPSNTYNYVKPIYH
ncbi:uncharacterized protein LOC143462846 isoform X1 [Clavelina lepadiformis]|uniref:uncharacterized protein LOC143462846 isoform X1 n=1 Tax=Clavelina lepadiformis TaxID=159417 RepID=UPI00404269B6